MNTWVTDTSGQTADEKMAYLQIPESPQVDPVNMMTVGVKDSHVLPGKGNPKAL